MNERSFIVDMAKEKISDKGAAIRRAALTMIVEEGLHGLSMQRLATKAGVSAGTIYLYFENRLDMLHQVYLEVRQHSDKAMLEGFSATMDFAVGLRLLWHNTFRYFVAHPIEFRFTEQFINSPLVAAVLDREDPAARQQRRDFYAHAIEKGQIADLPVEAYWAIAFAPLYQLIRFALEGSLHLPGDFQQLESKLEITLACVIKALQK
ncbi:TetR/AcrR family transcriptional regulator [Hymenobacter negativus]|uniref:TetR/AcrR family transcriptional regulator n=1 Tax=Hymenobacter negativus TaxID=2795026 RepID=A0ABS3QKW9_9BACT|nr:TetR/AcrR family transcriptional regulator [Hymenobacter negativus]MBO2011910.1 TetR/AcrR family transcriptional regulator [Hymenobacter negativus]